MKRMKIQLKDLFECMMPAAHVQIHIECNDGNVYNLTDIASVYALLSDCGLCPEYILDYYVVGVRKEISHINILVSEGGLHNV